MATRKAQDDAKPVEIPFHTYMAMCKVMDELAFRGPQEEALMMRVAKAGGIAEVMTNIKRRRIYGKKMADAKAARGPVAAPGDGTPAKKPRKPGGNRRRGDRKAKPDKDAAGDGSNTSKGGQEDAA